MWRVSSGGVFSHPAGALPTIRRSERLRKGQTTMWQRQPNETENYYIYRYNDLDKAAQKEHSVIGGRKWYIRPKDYSPARQWGDHYHSYAAALDQAQFLEKEKAKADSGQG